jgi:hypothetical protein
VLCHCNTQLVNWCVLRPLMCRIELLLEFAASVKSLGNKGVLYVL